MKCVLIWQEVQFIPWFMCVASNAAENSHSCDFYSSICSVMLPCIPLPVKKDKETHVNMDLSLNLKFDWFIFVSNTVPSLKCYFHYLLFTSFCNVLFFLILCFDFQPLLQYLFSQGAVSLACAANFLIDFFSFLKKFDWLFLVDCCVFPC